MQHQIPEGTTMLCPCTTCRAWDPKRPPPPQPCIYTYQVSYQYTARLADGTYLPATATSLIEGETPLQARSKLVNMLEALGHKGIDVETMTRVET